MIRDDVGMIKEVAATLGPGPEDTAERQEESEGLIDRSEAAEDPTRHGTAAVMPRFLEGLFVGEGEYEATQDDLAMERWSRSPKGHGRRILGRRRAGIRLVLEEATPVPVQDAHATRPIPAR